MADVTISREKRLFGNDVFSVKATVKAPASTGKTSKMKAGQIVFLNSDNDGFEALTAAGSTAIGVLAEDLTPTSTGVEGKVVIAGHVFIEGVREAGDDESYISDIELQLNASKIVFVSEKEAIGNEL